jgi:hypothetical protein
MENNIIPRWKRLRQALRSQVPDLNFITLHYIYFISTCLLSAIIFWGASTPARSVSFTDSLFLAVSAMTLAGLNTVNLSILNTFQQFMLFILIMLGSTIFVSASIVHIRRTAFERRFRSEIENERRQNPRSPWFSRERWSTSHVQLSDTKRFDGELESVTTGRELPTPGRDQPTIATSPTLLNVDSEINPLQSAAIDEPIPQSQAQNTEQNSEHEVISPPVISTVVATEGDVRQDRVTFSEDTRFRGRRQSRDQGLTSRPFLRMQGVGSRSDGTLRRLSTQSPERRGSIDLRRTSTTADRDPFSPSSEFRGRNSTFHHLDETDRERLGGTEYKAILFLSWMVPIYFIIWQFLSCLALGAYVHNYYSNTTRENGLNPWYVPFPISPLKACVVKHVQCFLCFLLI